MKIHIFKSLVHHDGKPFVKGQECPKDLLPLMITKGLVAPLPEAVKPVEPPKTVEPPKDEKK